MQVCSDWSGTLCNVEIGWNGCLPKSHKHIKKHKKYVFLFFYVSSPTVIPKAHKHINLFFYCYFLCVYVFMRLEFPRAYPVPPWKHKHISTYFMCLCGQVYVFLCVYGISVGTRYYI